MEAVGSSQRMPRAALCAAGVRGACSGRPAAVGHSPCGQTRDTKEARDGKGRNKETNRKKKTISFNKWTILFSGEKSREFAVKDPVILQTENTAIAPGFPDTGSGGRRSRPDSAHGAPRPPSAGAHGATGTPSGSSKCHFRQPLMM